ncbi:hypothetical protein K450DRAFT_244806 [Umbelopsis ramanniana AG]|uniref:VPS9 domain-containing protein n=1 Tax=Umbelopsis ramanniana AG TaxID=1314678 RepID=A0AAD5HDE1_UMBRA|nr:uncharacterized protein K450DRAFT_244806 [Umbelopsis ramanniana AG]KAI8578849.1 hypothetical protein K450DRAFT_244806 [Umbelopsis ramanniana AG]
MAYSNPLLKALLYEETPEAAELLGHGDAFIVIVPPLETKDELMVDSDFLASHIIHVPMDASSMSLLRSHHTSLPIPTASTSMLSRITSPRLERIGSLNFGNSSMAEGRDPRRRVLSYDDANRNRSTLSISSLEKQGITYTTLNQKTITISDTTLKAQKGFQYVKRTIKWNRLYFTKNGKHLLLLYIEKALMIPNSEMNRLYTRKPTTNPQNFRDILEAFPAISSPISVQLEQSIQAFCDRAIESQDLSSLHDDMKALLQKEYQLLENVDWLVIQHVMKTCRLTNEALDQIYESYIMERTYDIVFFKITNFQQSLDSSLGNALHRMSNLDLTQVGLPNISGMAKRLSSGLEVFREIGTFRTPKEKLDCLLATISKLTSSSVSKDNESIASAKSHEDPPFLNSDVLIPLLIITIIQSRVSNLVANLTYMKEYAFEHNVTTGEYGYALSTLEGVIQYLVESEHNLSEISLRNEQFWAHLRDGDLCYVKDIFDDENGEKLAHSTQSLQPTRQELDTEDAPPDNFPFWTSELEHSAGTEIADMLDEKETISRPTRPRTGSIRSISSGPRSLSVLHTRDPQGNNALLLACFSDNAKLVEYLLERQGGCGPRDLNNELRTPLMVAAMHGKIDVVKVLLRDKYIQETMEREDVEGNTALLLACAYADNEHYVSVVEELINTGGARLRVSNHQGNSPLHVAAMGSNEGHKQVLRLLSKMMSKDLLDGQNAEGSTVFHLCDSPDLCLALIQERGANAEIADKFGRSPFMAWSSKCNRDMVKFFLDHNIGRLDQADVHGQSALHLACNSDVLTALPLSNDENTKQVLDVLHMLLAQISVEQLNCRDRDGNTALHIAAMRSGGCPLVEILLENNASLDIYNKLGQRPVYVAKDSETINLLDDITLFRKPVGKDFDRQCTITRAEVQEAKIMYIIKCGTQGDRQSIVTVRRSLEDFRFIRQQISFELPETFMPTLSDILNPEAFDLKPPPLKFLETATQTLNRFLKNLFENNTLKIHELIWEFVMVPDLQRDIIRRRSSAKRDLLLDSIADEYSSNLENLESENHFFVFTKNTMQPLRDAFYRVSWCMKRLQSCAEDVDAELAHVGQEIARKQAFQLSSKWPCVAFLTGSSSPDSQYETDTMKASEFLQVIQGAAALAEGVLLGVQRPLNLIETIQESIDEMEKQKASLQRAVSWNDVFSTSDQRKKITDTKDQMLEVRTLMTEFLDTFTVMGCVVCICPLISG